MQKERMDGKLSQTKLSGLKIYYLSLTLRVVFYTKFWFLQTMFCVVWKQKLISSHFIPYFVSKIAYKASSLRVPNLVTKL